MSVFGPYSRYYDLLYRDKEYAGEAAYIHSLIQSRSPGAKNLLNLGCGSGRHDRELALLGYRITGVDRSEEMLACARGNSGPFVNSLEYLCGDLRSLRLGRSYDVVLALFHVFSYQATNADLYAAFSTVSAHLAPGGLCLFDCWYGPAVLTDRPLERVKTLEDEQIKLIRHAVPVMHPNDNLVDVCYRIEVVDKADGGRQELEEIHRMRYLFRPEVELLLERHGLKPVLFEEWMTGRGPDFGSWNVIWGATRRSDNKVSND